MIGGMIFCHTDDVLFAELPRYARNAYIHDFGDVLTNVDLFQVSVLIFVVSGLRTPEVTFVLEMAPPGSEG
jgi:hypothetical protein